MTEELERAEKRKKLREQWEGVTSFIKMECQIFYLHYER